MVVVTILIVALQAAERAAEFFPNIAQPLHVGGSLGCACSSTQGYQGRKG
jgi:hypothetical protein